MKKGILPSVHYGSNYGSVNIGVPYHKEEKADKLFRRDEITFETKIKGNFKVFFNNIRCDGELMSEKQIEAFFRLLYI